MYANPQKTPAGACCSGCGPDAQHIAGTALPNACTLDSSSFDRRVAAIRDLARRALVRSRRDGLQLHLNYRLTAFAEIAELVAREAQCCSFVAFDLHLEGGTVALTLTVLPSASAQVAAGDLFNHFINAKVAA